jgi:hypothetical protein
VSSRKSNLRRNLVRLVAAAIILIAVTISSSIFRSNVIYQNSLRTPSDLWPQTRSCKFEADGYHLLGLTNCPPPVFQQSSFNISVDVKNLNDGSQSFGDFHGFGFLLFSSSANSGYRYIINSTQEWFVSKIGENDIQSVDSGTNDAILPGVNAINRLEIHASSGHFNLYANGTLLGQVDDTAFSNVLLALSNSGDGSEVVFTNIKVIRASY